MLSLSQHLSHRLSHHLQKSFWQRLRAQRISQCKGLTDRLSHRIWQIQKWAFFANLSIAQRVSQVVSHRLTVLQVLKISTAVQF